jgi:hypothetical protein
VKLIIGLLVALYALAGWLVWLAARAYGAGATTSAACAARRFTRFHLWLVLASGLPAAAAAALLVLDWRPLWMVPTGPFAALLYGDWFTDWTHDAGAWVLSLVPWAFGGLAIGVAAQWLVPPRPGRLVVSRLLLWSAGWIAWFVCGVWSCLYTYG